MKFFNSVKLKYIVYFILAIVTILVVMRLFFIPSTDKPSYITETVKRGNVEKTVLADGTINAFKLINVGAQVSGQIKKLYVELGDEVKQGDMIAEIDDLKQNNDLKQAEASLENLKAQKRAKEANLVNYKLTYDRYLQLVKRGVGAQSDLDSAKAALDVIKADIVALDASIESAQIAVDTAKVNLGYTKITSPIDGVIVSIPVEAGQTVNSVQSAPTIVKVARLDKMTVEAKISEADVINVKKGMEVYFTILGLSNKHFDGLTLRSIEPAPTSIDDTTTSTSSTSTAIYYNGLFDVDNPDNILRISMTAQVYIVLDKKDNVLYIPSFAIQKNLPNNKAIVSVLAANNQAIDKEVEIGINNNTNVEIIKGLAEGDTVIVSRLDGSAVVSSNSRRPGIRF